MSGKTPFVLAFIEKIFGMVLAIIGSLLTYYTYTYPDAAGMATGFFTAIGLALIIIGLVLLVAKTG